MVLRSLIISLVVFIFCEVFYKIIIAPSIDLTGFPSYLKELVIIFIYFVPMIVFVTDLVNQLKNK